MPPAEIFWMTNCMSFAVCPINLQYLCQKKKKRIIITNLLDDSKSLTVYVICVCKHVSVGMENNQLNGWHIGFYECQPMKGQFVLS